MDTTTLTAIAAASTTAVVFLTLLLVRYLGFGSYTISRSSEQSLQQALARAGRGRTNHHFTGGTRSTSGHHLGKHLTSWQIDFDRIQVGQGEHAYSKAKQLLASLEHIQLGWSSAHLIEAKGSLGKAQEGAAVVLITRIFGAAYILTPLRIIYAVESNGVHCIPGSEATSNIRQLPCFAKGERFDVGLTSLEGSALCVEERYSVQWCQEDDTVWYEMYAISKPATLDAYLGYPLLRYYQRKVREASIAAMKKLVAPEEDTVDAAMRMWDTMKMG